MLPNLVDICILKKEKDNAATPTSVLTIIPTVTICTDFDSSEIEIMDKERTGGEVEEILCSQYNRQFEMCVNILLLQFFKPSHDENEFIPFSNNLDMLIFFLACFSLNRNHSFRSGTVNLNFLLAVILDF